jgi:hypothetical protein
VVDPFCPTAANSRSIAKRLSDRLAVLGEAQAGNQIFFTMSGKEKERIMADETTFQLASVQFDAEPVAVFRFGYERFELRARLGPGNLEHAIASAAEVAASVFAKWSHEALAFAQRVRAGEDGGPVRH